MRLLCQIFLALVASVGFGVTAASAASISSQPPCNEGLNSLCVTYNSSSPPTLTLRSFRINPPAAGRALIFFNGTAVCINSGSVPAAVTLALQILPNQQTPPVVNGPGGSAIGAVIPAMTGSGASELNGQLSFNLASNRVLDVVPGFRRVYFRVNRLQMDPDAFCAFGNLTFSVIYTP